MLDNPFLYGSIVDEDNFCPRSIHSDRLALNFKRGQNVALIGPRRVGKSSLIHHAANSIKGSTLAYADFWGIHTLADFIRRCIQALDVIEDKTGLMQKIAQTIPGLTVTVGMDPITGTPTMTPTLSTRKKAAPESIAQIARLWKALSEGKQKLIIALDEFQDVAAIEDGDQILGLLRKEIQTLGKIPFCFSGSIRNEMWRIFSDDRGAFYKSAAIIEISSEGFDDWRGFLRHKFESTRLKIDDHSLDEIIRLADGNPGDTQQLCSSVWEQAKSSNRRKIDPEIVTTALLRVFADERKGYEQIVSDVSGQQLAVLRTIAQLGGESVQSGEFLHSAGITHASSAKAAASRLVKRRILQETPGSLKFSNPFFQAWLLHVRY